MNCLLYFKDRNKGKAQKSAPVLKEQSKSSDISGATERATRSSCSASSPRSFSEAYEGKAQNLREFSFNELRQATNNFCRLLKIGEGGFGCVYKGMVKPVDGKGDRIVVAIKKLSRDGYQGHKQWVAEVQFLGVLEHPNLVKLIGYCAVDGERGIQRLLVYEFMPNRTLEDHLFSTAYPPLSWLRRLQIVLGAALGLTYLHEELEVQVIYRDFKSSNVLLDNDFKPKLSDFGLAREGPTGLHTHVSTAVVGTHGYAAPDYIETGHLTAKSDVWSFGVHYPADSRKFSMIMDPRLENQYSLGAARKVAKLADACLSKNSKERPQMSQVVESLKQIIQSCGGESSPLHECVEDDPVDDEKPKQMGPAESAKRRMAQLAKLSEHVGGISRRRFMMMQRAKVT
nr:probable serine/threonine-protein kinase PBL19 [Ipomoea batatas]